MTDGPLADPAPNQSTPLLTVRGVDKSFGATHALKKTDLTILPGEIHALVGENGAGKSTMIKVLAGALHADRGQIVWLGKPYRPTNPAHARRLGIATCYQELAIVPHMTAVENILLGQEVTAGAGIIRGGASRRRVRDLLASLEQADIPLNVRAGQMPIAQQQFIEIARAITSDARLVILDEPTSSLSREGTASLFKLVRRLRDQGVSFLYVSHFLEEIMDLCDRYTVMRDGETVAMGQVAQTSIDDLISMMVGRRVEDLYPQVEREIGGEMMRVEGLQGPKASPDKVSFLLNQGEILGIGGLVGSGRSELLRTIYGLRSAQGGSVRIAQWPQTEQAGKAPADLLGRGVGFASEDRKIEGLALSRSLSDNIGLSALKRATAGGFWVRPRRLKELAIRAADGLSTVYRDINQPAMDLSGGNQQKVALARLMFSEADVMLLDEPTRGIDVGSKAIIYQWLGAEAAEGKGIVMTSSYGPELLGVCDRIGVMYRGRLVALGPREQWSEEKLLLAATTGTNPLEEVSQ